MISVQKFSFYIWPPIYLKAMFTVISKESDTAFASKEIIMIKIRTNDGQSKQVRQIKVPVKYHIGLLALLLLGVYF